MDAALNPATMLRRAERIQSGGFHDTEIGPLPDDWVLMPVGTILSFKNGLNKSKEYFGRGTPIINYMDVFLHPGLLASDVAGCVEVSKQELENYSAKKGDVFFTRTSETLDEIGVASVLLEGIDKAVFSGFVLRGRPIKDELADFFKKYCFASEPVRRQIISKGTYTTRALTNGRALSAVLLPVPPTKNEQNAIGNVLSDADALIESLEQLIEKKRLIKQGAMQELLSGRRRLPGFGGVERPLRSTKFGMRPADWTPAPLERIASFITKGSTPTTYGFSWERDGVLFLRSECVSDSGLDLSESMFISDEAHSALRRSEVHPGDILITITGNVGRVILLGENIDKANINQHIARIRIIDGQVNREFLFHFLSQPLVRSYYNLITTGQAYPQISLKQVRDTEVPMPPLAEQNAIASILTSMDKEIFSLEEKLTKARQIKQGMMQELLTGRVRLV